MKKLLSILTAFVMAVSLAACGSGSGGGGKTFTFASELDIKNLDSCDADDGMSFNAMHAVIDGLMGLDENGEITMRTAQGAAAEAKRQIEQHTLTSQAVRTTSDGKTVIESVGEAREDRAADSAPKTTRTRGRLAGSASSKSARGRGHAVGPATADAAQGTDGQTTGTRRRGRPRKAAQMQMALAKAKAAAASVNAAVKDVPSVADVATK